MQMKGHVLLALVRSPEQKQKHKQKQNLCVGVGSSGELADDADECCVLVFQPLVVCAEIHQDLRRGKEREERGLEF